jgi:N-acetylglutamate synthase-like GNAT family acetyltransferase
MSEFTIRPPRPEEAAELSALCRRSKAHWGYDDAFIRQSEPSLTITDELIATGLVLVVQDAYRRSVGLASLEPLNDGVFDLLHMFVEPDAIGGGVGQVLFLAIAALARECGAKRLSILSDPNAAAFYEHMGAKRIGDAPSDAIPGRVLPLLEFDLDQ